MSQLTASTCHRPFVTDLPARISSPSTRFHFWTKIFAGPNPSLRHPPRLSGAGLRRPGSNESLWRQRRNFHRNCLRFSTSHSQSSRLPEGSFIYPGNRRRRVKPAVEAICRRVTTDIRHLIRPRGIRWHVRFQWPRVLPPLFVGKRWRAGRSHTRGSRMELPVPLRHPTQLKGICASLISPTGFTRRGNSNG